ncbi:MAG TPA: GNAT family N-acetyltransferase [Solirubrobacteraceae bacterium]|jgi:ribosomal protein S18 acetylase RimI-like enzyme
MSQETPPPERATHEHPPPAMRIEEATTASEELLAALAGLVAQLSSSAPAPDERRMREIVDSPASRLLLARDEAGTVLGMLTLALFPIPTGVRAWIEDVVIDERARGHGIASALTQAALSLAAEQGARTVDLTSRPDRDAANRLYAKLGFQRRETNVYRYQPPPA